MSTKGTNAKMRPGVCMVLGCGKKALYRPVLSKRYIDSGYCADHKHLCVTACSKRMVDRLADWTSEL